MNLMKAALKLAKKADPSPNPRVGAILVKNGKIIGQGFHKKAGMNHAEIEAIEDAKFRTNNPQAAFGSILYVTLEPCSHRMKRTPPCTDAIITSGISKVVFAMKDPNPLVSGAIVLRKAGIETQGPVAQKEAEKLNTKYIKSITRKPFVAIKMAMSADGKTATRTGDSKWISCEESRKFVHKLRNEYDAIVVGAGTVIMDNPRLTCRIKNGRNPIRIIIDGKLKIPEDAKVLNNPDGKTIIATSELASRSKIEKIASRSSGHVFVCGRKEVDLVALLDALGAMGIKKILIEGGSELNAKAIKARIVNKIILIVAPKIIGGRNARSVIGGNGIGRMNQAIGLKNRKIKKIGTDLVLEFDVVS